MKEHYKKIHWTEHSKIKMRQYGLSMTKLIHLLYKPERKEKGIVPGTTAVMKTNKLYPNPKKTAVVKAFAKKAPGEVWMMYKDAKDQRKIISAWRYPGVTRPGEAIPIPEDIRQEILNELT